MGGKKTERKKKWAKNTKKKFPRFALRVFYEEKHLTFLAKVCETKKFVLFLALYIM